jgi:hypothetical protein
MPYSDVIWLLLMFNLFNFGQFYAILISFIEQFYISRITMLEHLDNEKISHKLLLLS